MKAESPRIEDGVIKWYEGDIFYIDFELIDDETGEPYILKDGETVEIDFYWYDKLIKSFVFDHTADCSALTCYFDNETTALFTCGKYKYSIKRNGEMIRQTVDAKNEVEVEKCH